MGPQIPNVSELFTLMRHVWMCCLICFSIISLRYVSIYRKNKESEPDIQNNKHKIHQQCQTTFEQFIFSFRTFRNTTTNHFFLLCICIISISYILCIFGILETLYILYYTYRSLTRVGLLHVWVSSTFPPVA